MRNHNRLILLLAIARFVIPYLLQSPVYEPHRDEFLYLAEGQHLAWGFLEVPPLISVFAWLSSFLGNSIFWIKFWPNLFGSLTFFVCAKMIVKLGGGKLALWLLFFVFVFGAWLRMFFLFQPNAPEIFFSALMAYGLLRFVQTSKTQYLYAFGIAVGLGMLTKYTIAFWTVSLLAGLLFTDRKVFLNKHLYYALGAGFLIFLPNFVWQWTHDFPVLHHMQELKETQLDHVSAGDFLKDELLMYLPVFYIWIAGLLYCFTSKGRKVRAFGIAFLVLQGILLLLQGKAYYSAGSFTVLFALGAYYPEQIFSRINSVFKYTAIGFSVLSGLALWPLLLPVASPAKLASLYKTLHFDKAGVLKWEDLKNHELPQDFADMLGWKEMAAGVSKAYSTLDSSEKRLLLIWCDNYGQAGAVNYYRKESGIPEAYSSNGSFLFWLPSTDFPDNVILVSENQNPLEDPLIKQFTSIVLIDSVRNPYAREYRSTILVLKHPSEKLKEVMKKEIEGDRNQFIINRYQ